MLSTVQLLAALFACLMIVATGCTAAKKLADSKFLLVCTELEYILDGIVGITTLFGPPSSFKVYKRDIYKPVCMIIISVSW